MQLKDFRDAVGLTQADLADKLGVARSTIAEWESGRRHPGHQKTVALAAVLHVSVDELLGVAPTEDDREILTLLAQLPEAKRAAAIDYLRYLAKDKG